MGEVGRTANLGPLVGSLLIPAAVNRVWAEEEVVPESSLVIIGLLCRDAGSTDWTAGSDSRVRPMVSVWAAIVDLLATEQTGLDIRGASMLAYFIEFVTQSEAMTCDELVDILCYPHLPGRIGTLATVLAFINGTGGGGGLQQRHLAQLLHAAWRGGELEIAEVLYKSAKLSSGEVEWRTLCMFRKPRGGGLVELAEMIPRSTFNVVLDAVTKDSGFSRICAELNLSNYWLRLWWVRGRARGASTASGNGNKSVSGNKIATDGPEEHIGRVPAMALERPVPPGTFRFAWYGLPPRCRDQLIMALNTLRNLGDFRFAGVESHGEPPPRQILVTTAMNMIKETAASKNAAPSVGTKRRRGQ